MNREILYHIPVDICEMTRQEAEQIDREQPQRERVNSWEMEDLCAMKTLLIWLRNITQKPHMQALFRKAGVYPLSQSGSALLKKAFEHTLKNVSAVQIRTMDANFHHITLSSTQVKNGFVNVDTDALETLIQGTLEACREKFCMQSDRESRTCPVRQALDNTLNAGRIRNSRKAAMGGLCPYCLGKREE